MALSQIFNKTGIILCFFNLFSRVVELCSVKLTDTDKELRYMYQELLKNVPFQVTAG